MSLLFAARNELERESWTTALKDAIYYNASEEARTASQNRPPRFHPPSTEDGPLAEGAPEAKEASAGDAPVASEANSGRRTQSEVVELRSTGISQYVRQSVSGGAGAGGRRRQSAPEDDPVSRQRDERTQNVASRQSEYPTPFLTMSVSTDISSYPSTFSPFLPTLSPFLRSSLSTRPATTRA